MQKTRGRKSHDKGPLSGLTIDGEESEGCPDYGVCCHSWSITNIASILILSKRYRLFQPYVTSHSCDIEQNYSFPFLFRIRQCCGSALVSMRIRIQLFTTMQTPIQITGVKLVRINADQCGSGSSSDFTFTKT
jgi:hypothetical protein